MFYFCLKIEILTCIACTVQFCSKISNIYHLFKSQTASLGAISGHTLVPGPEVLKLVSCSTQLSMLINVKMPTIIGILTFVSLINTPSECFK